MAKPARPYRPTEPPAEPEHRPSYGDCTFRCNTRYRAAVRAHDTALAAWIARDCTGPEPAPIEIQPWPGDPILCRRCASVIRGALRELPLAYTALASVKFLTRSASADEERRGRSDVPPSPSPGADHADEILRTTASWEDDLRQHLGHHASPHALDPDPLAALTASVGYLNANYQAMTGRINVAADFTAEIWRLHATALAMVKNKPIRRHLPAPCPSCDMLALIQEEGIAGKPWYVECVERAGGCGRLYQEQEWSWLVQLLNAGHVRKAVAA